MVSACGFECRYFFILVVYTRICPCNTRTMSISFDRATTLSPVHFFARAFQKGYLFTAFDLIHHVPIRLGERIFSPSRNCFLLVLLEVGVCPMMWAGFKSRSHHFGQDWWDVDPTCGHSANFPVKPLASITPPFHTPPFGGHAFTLKCAVPGWLISSACSGQVFLGGLGDTLLCWALHSA